MNPLAHFLLHGEAEGRRSFTVAEATDLREKGGELTAEHSIKCFKAPVVTGEAAVLTTRSADGTIQTPRIPLYLQPWIARE